MYLERIPIHLPDPEKQEKGKVDEWVNNTRNQLMLYSQTLYGLIYSVA